MTRDQLEHGIRAACDVANDHTVIVFGSQAILGSFPNAPPALRQSVEMDASPLTRPDRVDAIDGSLGELSQFHATHGFYVHGLPIDEAATLPDGWRERLVPVNDPVGTRGCTGLCLEAHDLAASKLAAFRDKDRDYVRVLLLEGMVDRQTLIGRVGTLPTPEPHRDRCIEWINLTIGGGA